MDDRRGDDRQRGDGPGGDGPLDQAGERPSLDELPPEVKARRAASFGAVAAHYERFRPGPPAAAVDWFLPTPVDRVVDLGAGTGALTRLLVGRASEVVAVEPDDQMRAVLDAQVPGARTVAGRGESMPLPDGSVDVVLASTSWHWVEPVAGLTEVARVLVPGGLVGAVWSGPDSEAPFLAQAQQLLAGQATSELGDLLEDGNRRPSQLAIPAGLPFTEPEVATFTWDVALNADELIGLLGTFSWFILLPDDRQDHMRSEARRLLAEALGVEGDTTVDVGFRANAFRSRCTA